MKPGKLLFVFAASALAVETISLRPPLWRDADDLPIPKPKEQQVSELFGIMNNSWLRHTSVEEAALRSRDRGALNVNAWDGVPDSSWFTNRIGRKPMTYEEVVESLGGAPPQAGRWLVERNVEEGYTPKFRIRDQAGRRYWVKFDLPDAPERNSGAERISTLILHAAGYNVPFNCVVRFRAEDLEMAADAKFTDSLGRQRAMTAEDLRQALGRLKPDERRYFRGLASLFIAGEPLGKFKYSGTRADDGNDIIPHELRRELRGLRVIASWINHADTGDKNTHDAFVSSDGKTGFVKHYLLDFGSTLGSGDYVNGPYRIGHEHVFDGAAMSKTFWSFGAWRRPWEAQGRIDYREVGYYSAELFDPGAWKPNYPNLAFVRMDLGDAYWAARIVAAFPDELIERIVASADYSNAAVARAVSDTLKRRRDMVVAYWMGRVTGLDEFAMEGSRLRFRDVLGGDGESPGHARRFRVLDRIGRQIQGQQPCDSDWCDLDLPSQLDFAPVDRYGRRAAAQVLVEESVAENKWGAPVEVVLGRQGNSTELAVLGWRHGGK